MEAPPTLPGFIEILDYRLPLIEAETVDVVYALTRGPTELLDIVSPGWESWAMREPQCNHLSDLDMIGVGFGLSCRLAGWIPSLPSWRKTTRVATYIASGPEGWAAVIGRGIDPYAVPPWMVFAAALYVMQQGCKPDELERKLTAPSEVDDSWISRLIPVPVTAGTKKPVRGPGARMSQQERARRNRASMARIKNW